MKSTTTLCALGALLLTSACGDSTPIMFELGHAPRAVVSDVDGEEVFTGELAPPDFGDDEDVSTLRFAKLDVSDLSDGQLVSAALAEPGASGDARYARRPAGTFTIGSSIEIVGDADVTIESVSIRYPFYSGELDFERAVSQTVRVSGGRSPLDIELIASVDESDRLATRFLEDAMALGGAIITIPIEVTLEGTSSGGGVVRSNTLVYPLTLCDGCAEIDTTPYALGSVKR